MIDTPREPVHWHDTTVDDSPLAQITSCYLPERGVDMKQIAEKRAFFFRIWILLAFLSMAAAVPAATQKKDKNKDKNTPPPSDLSAELQDVMHTSDGQAIDQSIGEALGYWQIGDTDSLHKYYSDDVVIVSGTYEPPIVGWDNFLKDYKAERARVAGARMDRSNTLIKVNGNSAWATYQFVYVAQMDGKVAQFRGHTTLVLAKRADRWVITLNHSSIVDSSVPEPATSSLQSSEPAGKP